MRLKDKVAIVTGGARGMGQAIVKRFAEEGAIVFSADVAQQEPAGSNIHAVKLDVSSEEDWKRVVAQVLAAHGHIDILVNNAGILAETPVAELTMAEWSRSIGINQTGVFLGMREVLPGMRSRKAGAIVNFSSTFGIAAVPGAHAYHATKGAVRSMSKNAAMTYVSDGIRVNSVHPGIIDTGMIDAMDADAAVVVAATPMKRKGTPLEVANGVLFLASDEASFITGTELVIDGGYLAQ